MKVIELCAVTATMNVLLSPLIGKLKKEGFEVVGICSANEKGKEVESKSLINIEIARKINVFSNIKTIVQLVKIFKKEKPDIVHVHTPVAAVLGRIAAKLAKVPIIIYTAHGFYFHENMNLITYRIVFYIEKFMGRFFTDYIFTQSREDYLTAKKNNFLNEHRIFNIGNGVDISRKFNKEYVNKENVERLKNNLSIKENELIITFIGRLVREKGILDLLNGFSEISDKNVKLLIVGHADKSERDLKCKEELKRYMNNSNILFLGKRDDINELLYISDIFCLPSYREGMPRSIIEAMASECAVITTNIRGCREEVVNNETGYVVKINSPYEIKEKIEVLIDDKEKLNTMKINGRKRAEKLYNEELVLNKQVEILNSILKTRREL